MSAGAHVLYTYTLVMICSAVETSHLARLTCRQNDDAGRSPRFSKFAAMYVGSHLRALGKTEGLFIYNFDVACVSDEMFRAGVRCRCVFYVPEVIGLETCAVNYSDSILHSYDGVHGERLGIAFRWSAE